VEELLIEGHAYRAILGQLPEGCGLSERNLKEHFVRHLRPLLEAEGVRQHREEQAESQAQAIKAGGEVVADTFRFARRVVNRVDQRLASGEIEPKVQDAVAAASLLARHEEKGGLLDRESVMKGFMFYMQTMIEILEEYVPDRKQEFLQAFSRNLGANPAMRELLARHEAAQCRP
jgi:hypothetical protein